MFQINEMEMYNFRSYKGPHKFAFPTKAGLYYLTGINLVDDLGANGSGKTTFIDAIVWCLYGQTTRGLKATDVLPNWSEANCKVQVTLTVADQVGVITRTQKPNSLLLNDKPVDQVELEAFLRLNYFSFLNSVVNSQFGTSFFSLSASQKLTLFSQIKGLEKWVEISQRALRSAQQIEHVLESKRIKQNKLKGSIRELEEGIEELLPKEVTYKEDVGKQIDDLVEKAVAAGKEAQELSSSLRALLVEEKDIAFSIGLKSRSHKYSVKERDTELKEAKNIAKSISARQAVVNIYNKQIERFRNIKNRNCMTCEQHVPPKHADAQILMLKQDLKREEGIISSLKIASTETVQSIAKLKLEIETSFHEIENLRERASEVNEAIAKQEQQFAHCIQQEVDYQLQTSTLRKRANPWTALINEQKGKLAESKQMLEQSNAKIAKLEKEHSAHTFWVKGFKRVRLYIIEKAFNALELEVNNCLSQLGMQEWQVTFDIEKENKSGGVTKGFVLYIQSPHNKQPVRWENWSGGETQRLQLAGDLGLANLIMQEAGLSNSIEFYDEPSSHLSTEGMMDLANMLHERALNEKKTIWIVDHTSVSNFGEFEDVVTIRKDKDGSSIS